jgi:DNA-binding NarL/FixJ family response regulator
MSDPIRILIADDHSLFRAGLARLLGDYPDLSVVGEASSANEAVHKAVMLTPDIILIDIDMPDEDGVTATRRIKRALPDARIVMLTMYARDSYVLEAIRAGAYGYLLKDASADELVSTIRTVARGGAVISPRLARRILDEFARLGDSSSGPERERAADDLSPREVEILMLIAAGHTTRSIAQTLYLSENTVKRHTSNIYQKLHVKHRSQAAVEAVRRGLIPAQPVRPSQQKADD